MRSAAKVCVLLGFLFHIKHVNSKTRLIERRPEWTLREASNLQEDIQTVIRHIHSLSSDNETPKSKDYSHILGSANLDAYIDVLRKVYATFQTLVREGFIDDLPKTVICILSGKQDCGIEAELTKAVSLKLVKPLLTVVSSLRQTCTPQNDGTDTELSSFLSRSFLGMGESATVEGFHQTFVHNLLNLLFSGNLLTALSRLLDAAVTFIFDFMAASLQVPMEFIKIALQFGIRIPSLDDNGTCEQGDLKELIMWGIKHNLSWSFGNIIIDILLDTFLEQGLPLCTYPGQMCPNPPSESLRRSALERDTKNSHYVFSQCDLPDVAELNDTLCIDVIKGSRKGSSSYVNTLCQTLNSLPRKQLEQVWSNTCYVIKALVSPLLSKSSDCLGVDTHQYVTSLVPISHSAPHRKPREAPNLQQLACDYNNWLEDHVIDAVLISLCSDNDKATFVRQVCLNTPLFRKLVLNEMNSWLYGYCANSSVDPGLIVSQFCVYEQWMTQPATPVNPALIELCMSLDSPRLTQLICEHTGFFMLLFSYPENFPFKPNCTTLVPQPETSGLDLLLLDSCQYSEWHDVMLITTDVLSLCIRNNPRDFAEKVCANKSLLNDLLHNENNVWLEGHCKMALASLPTEAPQTNIADWCDYQTWGERQVDDSVVGLCWQHDQFAFHKNVCCSTSVLEKLLENPQNRWLKSVCTDKEVDEIQILPEVCKYSEWTQPVIVDMTELALCAEIDQSNFTSKVCASEILLRNLLANQDNAWLIQHCANHSNPGENGGQGGGEEEFNPEVRCQYSTWSTSLPDAAVLTLCWEHDQPRFISSICSNSALPLLLARRPFSVWVSTMCATYTNYTTARNTTGGNDFCLAKTLVMQLNWTCSADFTAACQLGASQSTVLQVVLRCWVESLKSRAGHLVEPPVAAVLEQIASTTVVVLLALEDVQNTSLGITESIRISLLESVVHYLEGEKNFDKKRILLQCFGTVLTSLMQTARDSTGDEFFLVKEYFSIPLSSLKSVIRTAPVTTVRLILQYYSIHKDTLQLPDEYLPTLVSVLFHNHLVKDESLFTELAALLETASPSDIPDLPLLQNNPNVRETINRNLCHMSLEQRHAFGLWYSKIMPPSKITKGHQALIRDTGNVIAYLPFHNFQHLSPAQLLDGVDILQRNTLTPLKQEFIAQSIIGTFGNLTAQDFTRLAKLSCLADPQDLLAYKGSEAFSVIWDIVMNCTREGYRLPSLLTSSLLLNHTDLKVPSSISPDQLIQLAHLLPSLGVTFLQDLTPLQLFTILPALESVIFSPAQASVIVEKLSLIKPPNTPGWLQELGSLTVGIRMETLLTLTSDRLLSSLPDVAQHTPDLSPPQANAISTKLWGFPEVYSWLDDMEPLLHSTPLISIQSRTHLLVSNITNVSTKSWNTQQAKAIFQELYDSKPTLVKHDLMSLGTLGQGVSCKVLQELIRTDFSYLWIKKMLAFLRQQPHPLHTSLKKCVIEELYQFDIFSELLQDLGVEIALSMPVSTIKKFPADMIDTLRNMIIKEQHYFLLLRRTKQELLVDKMVQRLGLYTGVFTKEEFCSLGIMATFVLDEVFIKLDRRFFTDRLDYLRGLCYSSSKMDIIARILQEPDTFGPVKTWNQTVLSQVDRFLFFLPEDMLQEISMPLMTVGRIEKLFISQSQWEDGDVGIHCWDKNERKRFSEKKQFVLQFFLGFLKMHPLSLAPMVPTCEILHTTAPYTWTSNSLIGMSPTAFTNCLELMGHDLFLTSYQRNQILNRVKQMYGPVSSFSQSIISQLGGLALEMSPEELSSLQLTEGRSIAALGAVTGWSSTQSAALFNAVLNSTKQSPSQLESSTLVALGYIVCGAKSSEMNLFNAVEFSKAVLWLGQLKLSCSEEQLLALVGLLTHSLAFGPISSWGTDVFIEIGVLTAGLPDMAMSALVKEQIEGITPMAIAMTAPDKFAVVFHQRQLSMFSYEQAVAVTNEQLSSLSDVQRTALAMVLTPWEDRPVDFRGKSLGSALSHSPVCLILGLLMLLVILPTHDLIGPGS